MAYEIPNLNPSLYNEEQDRLEMMENEQQLPEYQSKYFALLDGDELISKFEEKIDQFYRYTAYNKLSYLWAKARLFSFIGLEYHGDIDVFGENDEYAAMPMSRLRTNVQKVLVSVIKNRPHFEPIAANADYKSLAQTELAKGILEYYMADKRVERYLQRITEFALHYGEGFLVPEWNPFAGEPEKEEMLEQSETGFQGDLEFKTFTPNNVPRDVNVQSYEDSNWIFTIERLDKHIVGARYKNQVDGEGQNIQEYIENLSQCKPNQYDLFYQFEHDQGQFDEDYIELKTFYHKPCEALPNGRYVRFVEGMILEDEMNLPGRRIPAIRSSAADIAGKPFGYTFLFELLMLQTHLDFLYTVIVTNQRNFSLPIILTQRSAKAKVREALGGVLKFLEYEDIADVRPEAVSLLNTSEEIFRMIEELKKDMDTICGLSPYISHGDLPNAQLSGSAMLMLAYNSIEYLSVFEASYVAAAEDIGTMMVQLLRDNASTPRVVRLAGKSKKHLVKFFTRDDIIDIDRVMVSLDNPVLRTGAGLYEMGKAMYDRGEISAQQWIAFQQTKELDLLTESPEAEVLRIRSENDTMFSVEIPDDIFQLAKAAYDENIKQIQARQQLIQLGETGMMNPQEAAERASQLPDSIHYNKLYTILLGEDASFGAMDSDNHILHIREHKLVGIDPETPPAIRWLKELHDAEHYERIKKTPRHILYMNAMNTDIPLLDKVLMALDPMGQPQQLPAPPTPGGGSSGNNGTKPASSGIRMPQGPSMPNQTNPETGMKMQIQDMGYKT